MNETYFKAAQIGVVAGMRSLMAPALVSRYYHSQPTTFLLESSLKAATYARTADVCTLLAAGELIGDKLPDTPDRTGFPQILGRLGSGAVSGATIAQANGKSAGRGAVAGSLGALLGTYAFFQLRHWLTSNRGLPDAIVALAEDALAIGAGLLILNRDHEPARYRSLP